jgi:hypothetical protein
MKLFAFNFFVLSILMSPLISQAGECYVLTPEQIVEVTGAELAYQPEVLYCNSEFEKTVDIYHRDLMVAFPMHQPLQTELLKRSMAVLFEHTQRPQFAPGYLTAIDGAGQPQVLGIEGVFDFVDMQMVTQQGVYLGADADFDYYMSVHYAGSEAAYTLLYEMASPHRLVYLVRWQ